MKNYNTTDLDPQVAFERHIFHRDQFAHYLRWSHIIKEAKIGETIVDFGCGKGNLLEVMYRNKFKCKQYIGVDIRKQTILQAQEKFANVLWANFYIADLVKIEFKYLQKFRGDKVCSFEVLEHVGKQNADRFMRNFLACGHPDAIYYISTPNYDETVGAAQNHTYDAGDGRGVVPQEFTFKELEALFMKHAQIVRCFGTFASIKDYKHLLTGWKLEMFNTLKEYYDSNLLSNMMAPLFPAHSRNTLWVLKRKEL